MKKLTLLTTGFLTLACLGGQAMTAEAASLKDAQVIRNGNSIVISYGINDGSNCDSEIMEQIKTQIKEQIREQLENKWNNLCPPDVNAPDTDAPDINVPDTNVPDTNVPDTNVPDTNVPGIDAPDADVPDINVPDTNVPGTNAPGTDAPDTNAPGTNAPDTPDTNLSYVEQVVNLVNKEREKRNLAPLSIDKSVQAAAQVRAQECEQSFSHTRPDGSGFATALKEQKVSYRTAGENIAWGQRSPEEVVNAWMNSDGHRANILSARYTSIGVGYYQNARGVNYWSQLFIG